MADTRTPVEVTTRFATTVDDLAGAWTFVMERVDRVGEHPSIDITPVWTVGRSGEEPRHFSVVVSGMVEEVNEDPNNGGTER